MEETEVETVVRLRAADVRDLFPDISAEDVHSRVCLLCTMRLKDKTHNLTRHLERHHLGALLQLMEQRAVTVATATTTLPSASASVPADSKPSSHTPVKASNTSRAARTRAQTQVSLTTSPHEPQSPRSASRRRAKRPAPTAAAAVATTTAIAALSDSSVRVTKQKAAGNTGSDTVATSSAPAAVSTAPSAAVSLSKSSEHMERAARALAHWLAHEQLPLSVVESAGFQRFASALNADFAALSRDEVQRGLAALHSGDHDSSDTHTHKRAKRLALLSTTTTAAAPVMTTRALVARCRIRDDVPLVRYEQLACRVLPRGFVRVRVQLALASHADQQTCCGHVPGRQGVLGRAFVGVVERVHTGAASTACILAPHERVVLATPELPCDACTATGTTSCAHDALKRFGDSSPRGALSEWLDLPAASLVAVPSVVPDDLALLAADVAVALQIAKALEQRRVETLAVVTDGVGGCALALLLHHVHHTLGLARERVHVLATAVLSEQQQSRLRELATLTALDVRDPSALDDVLSEQLAFGAVVDLCATEASCEFAISLVEPMGAILLVDRARLHVAHSATEREIAMDMNAVVVNELELLSVGDCASGTGTGTAAALAYLAAQSAERCAQLRTLLLPPVTLDTAHEALLALPDDALLAQHLVVRCSDTESQ